MNSSVILPSQTGLPRANRPHWNPPSLQARRPPIPLAADSRPRIKSFATRSRDTAEPGLDLHIHVLYLRRAERREAYINVYLAEIASPGRDWVPGHPITYPNLCSRTMPFQHVVEHRLIGSPYLGVLISLCDPGHRELDWSCQVFRTEDGALALDRRYGRR